MSQAHSKEIDDIAKSLPQIEIETELHVSDSVIAKGFPLPAGSMLAKEKHDYSHLSYLQYGRAVLRRGDETMEIVGPVWIEVLAGVWHSVEALTDILWICIHSTSQEDVQKHLTESRT